jgi:hypothetical protein
MELTAAEREQIYREEKAKRESDSGVSTLLLVLTAGAIIGLAGMLALLSKNAEAGVSLEDLRRAYSGLSPEEEQ